MKRLFKLMLAMLLVISMVTPVYATSYDEYPDGMSGDEYQQYLIDLAGGDPEGEAVYYDNLVLKKVITNKKGEGVQLMLFDPNRGLTLIFDFSATVAGVKQLKGKGVCFDYAYKEDYLLIHVGDDINEGTLYSDQDDINDLAE